MTIAPAIYEVDEEEDQEIVDMLLTNEHTPREPRLITTPPPKVTRKKMKYVNQRQQRDEDARKTPHWNPVGERMFSETSARAQLTWNIL